MVYLVFPKVGEWGYFRFFKFRFNHPKLPPPPRIGTSGGDIFLTSDLITSIYPHPRIGPSHAEFWLLPEGYRVVLLLTLNITLQHGKQENKFTSIYSVST